MSSAADADAGDRLHYSKPSDRARPRYRTPTSSRERRAPAGPNRSPTKYTYLFFFSNLLANLSVPKWRPSGRIPGVACLAHRKPELDFGVPHTRRFPRASQQTSHCGTLGPPHEAGTGVGGVKPG